jgi:tetratricopeptide (TPR) repeat protein
LIGAFSKPQINKLLKKTFLSRGLAMDARGDEKMILETWSRESIKVRIFAIAVFMISSPAWVWAAEPLASCEQNSAPAEIFLSGVKYEQMGLKGVAMRCYDLARRGDWREYRYHRAYIRVAHQIGRQADIFEEYQKPAADPDFEVARLVLLSRLHENEAVLFVDLAQQAVNKDPNDLWAANALGAGYDVLGNGTLAIQTLEAAYERFGKHPETALILANVLRNHGRLNDRVFQLLGEAEKDQYYRPYAVAFTGSYQIQMKDEEHGVATLKRNIVEYPYLGLSYIVLGDYYLQKNDIDLAVRYYIDAISRNLVDAIFYNNASWNLLGKATQRSDIALAKELAEMAVLISARKNATILDTLAEAYFKLGQKEDAIRIAKEAKSLAASDRESKYIQDQVDRFEGVKQ